MSSVLVGHAPAGVPAGRPGHAGVPPQQHVLQLATGYMVSSALHVVVSLRVADFMASGLTRVADLARLLSVNEDALYRVLRVLAPMGKGPRSSTATCSFGSSVFR